MNAIEISNAAATGEMPDGLSPLEKTLWFAKAGHWHKAHDLCQELKKAPGAWIHAWLHRQEGDYGNACYWYSVAGKPATPQDDSLEKEWFRIAEEVLSQKS